MKYNLSDFFVSIIHIFVIFMPGGIFLYAGYLLLQRHIDPGDVVIKSDPLSWVVLLAASFVLGHFISLIASKFEDKDNTLTEDDLKLRAVAYQIVRSKLPDALLSVDRFRRWGSLLLRQAESPAYGDIERKDADRRFFRNIRAAFLLIFILVAFSHLIYPIQYFWVVSIVLLVLFYASHLRYKNQDRKYSQHIFESLIAAFPPVVSAVLNSTEARWFFSNKDPVSLLQGLFASLGTTADWADEYYFLKSGSDLGVKWRAGRVELKSKLSEENISRDNMPSGIRCQRWSKQAFGSDNTPQPGSDPEHGAWVKVQKRRQRIKYILQHGDLQLQQDADRYSNGSGCVLELTELKVADSGIAAGWTFAVEAFGLPENQQQVLLSGIELALDKAGKSEAVTLLERAVAMPYPEWLEQVPAFGEKQAPQ